MNGHLHTLITGPSGSGKTYVSAALRNKGINALDADSIPGLCGWFNKKLGHQVLFPPGAGKPFLDNHAFLWNRDNLARFLANQQAIYLFGISRNAFDMLDLFHKVYFLKASQEVIINRLSNPSRNNPMGRTAYQLEYTLFWAQKNEENARRLGIEMIEADQSPDEIFARIQYLPRRSV